MARTDSDVLKRESLLNEEWDFSRLRFAVRLFSLHRHPSIHSPLDWSGVLLFCGACAHGMVLETLFVIHLRAKGRRPVRRRWCRCGRERGEPAEMVCFRLARKNRKRRAIVTRWRRVVAVEFCLRRSDRCRLLTSWPCESARHHFRLGLPFLF